MRSPLLLVILAAMGCTTETADMCMDVDDDLATCPAADDVNPDELWSTWDCDATAVKVLGEGSFSTNPWYWDSGGDSGGGEDIICCYPTKVRDSSPFSECMIGRPFLEGGAPTCAPESEGAGWVRGLDGGDELDGADVVPPRPHLAEAWLRAARMEHASIAAFARLTLELMALGAPADLLLAVQRAAADEVEHAQACYTLASRFAGRAVGPGPFPFGEPVRTSADLATLAAEAVREGCVGETIGAWQARRLAERARDPEVKALLQRIAEDEARHAALSWRVVAWAVREGGEPVRQAVREAFASPQPCSPMLMVELEDAADFGVAGPEASHRMALDAVREVIEPAARALLAA